MTRTTGQAQLSLGFRALFATIIAALLLALSTIPANAAPPDQTRSRTTNLHFSAYSQDLFLDVFKEYGGYVVCVHAPSQGASGCTFVSGDVLQVDRKLTSATLSAVTIPLHRCSEETWECEDAGTVTVSGTFTGESGLIRFSSRYRSSNGCTFMNATRGIAREGVATITVDGTSYSANATIAQSTHTFRVQCR